MELVPSKPWIAARVFGLGLGFLLLHAALPVCPTWANDAKEPPAQIDEQLFSRYKEAKKHERSDDRENAKAAYLEILDLLKPVDEKNLFKRLVVLDYEAFKTRKGPLVIAGVEPKPELESPQEVEPEPKSAPEPKSEPMPTSKPAAKPKPEPDSERGAKSEATYRSELSILKGKRKNTKLEILAMQALAQSPVDSPYSLYPPSSGTSIMVGPRIRIRAFLDLSDESLDSPHSGLSKESRDRLKRLRPFIEKKDYDSAIEQMNSAIKDSPDTAAYYLMRAFIRQCILFAPGNNVQSDSDNSLAMQDQIIVDLRKALDLGIPCQIVCAAIDQLVLSDLHMSDAKDAAGVEQMNSGGSSLGDLDATPDQKTRQKKIHIPSTKREYEAIIAKAQARLKENPDDAGAYIDMGYAYGNLLDSKKDIECCNKAIAIDPNIAVAFSERARGYMMQRQFDKALADLDKAISIDPNNSAFHATRGWIYCHQKRYREAIAACTKSISMYDGYSPAYFCRARAQNALGKYWNATIDCTRAIELYPNEDSRYYSERGYAYVQMDNYPKAIADFNTALKIEPDNLSALIYRGQALIYSGDSRAAVSTLNEAIRLDPEEAYSYTCRALAYMKLNNDARALQDLNKALALDPDDADTNRLRGSYYLEKAGDYQKAIVDLGRSLKADPSSTSCNANMAKAYMKLKLFDKAIEHWNNVIKLSPSDGGAYSGRGLAYGALGQFDKERADCNAAISREPGKKQMYLKLHARAFQ